MTSRSPLGPLSLIGLTYISLLASVAIAQEATDPLTLLPPATLAAIANELSGAQALAHVLEMTPYERNRPPEEYGAGTYREAA